jgi:DNA-directed RNA polymerase subunit K/omega
MSKELEAFEVSDDELAKKISESEAESDVDETEESGNEVDEESDVESEKESDTDSEKGSDVGSDVGSEEDEEENVEEENKENEEKKAAENNRKLQAAKNKAQLLGNEMNMLGIPHGHGDEDDTDEDSDDSSMNDEEHFQKLDDNLREDYVMNFHPEILIHNYDEIQNMAKVVRNKAGIVVDELHKTVPFMTKYERTRILGQRTKQLNEGAKPMIKIDASVVDGYLIALKELEQKKIPFIIRRPLPNGGSEYWRIRDLEII